MFEYQNGIHSHQEQMVSIKYCVCVCVCIDNQFFHNIQQNNSNNREDRHSETASSNRASRLSATAAVVGPVGGSSRISSGDEEWRNIHTMLSCISGMAEKTKKAISILQNRGNDTPAGSQASAHQEVSMISDLRRQTEERIDEIRRNAEDAVNQVSFPSHQTNCDVLSAVEFSIIFLISSLR